MTIKDLYDWAVEQGIDTYDIASKLQMYKLQL